MSNDRDYPNSGIMFRDDRKQSERDCDYRGTADIRHRLRALWRTLVLVAQRMNTANYKFTG
jgi:hypothetical protein